MFVFDSNLGNIKILFIGDDDTAKSINSILIDLVAEIFFVHNYDEADVLITANHIDIIINSLPNLQSTELDIAFRHISHLSIKHPILLIINEQEIIQIRQAIKYNISNLLLYPIDKDILVEELNRIVNDIYHKIEVENINKQLQELNQTLDKRVQEEIEKNKQKDHMMHHQARLAAMGEMIGNIAHQWRQPLTAISTIIQTLEYKESKGKLTTEFLQKQTGIAKQIVSQMSQTIDDFRNFFKPNKMKEIFDVSKVINHNINFLLIQFNNNDIEIVFENKESIEITSYKNELSQAMLNIFNNAKDALLMNNSHKRKLIFVDININYELKKVFIIIKDNAQGIPENIINRIFEPYFTTKHQSHGTGIGLYMTKQIVETNMKGTIRVENKMYQYDGLDCIGAEFVISLPFEV